MEDLLNLNRQEEMDVLRELLPHIQACPRKLWMLSIITKQDLWWSDQAETQKRYEDGEYGKAIHEVVAARDRRQFRHEFVFASLVISNFDTGAGECLKRNCEGYDHRKHSQSLHRVFETLDAMRIWESHE